MSTFKIGSLQLEYYRGDYNKAYENERSVEVSLGQWFLNKFGIQTVEIGCVMPYYGFDKHLIYDLCDTHPHNIQANALDLDYKGKNVLCLSTIEHLNQKEYSNGSDQDAITLLNLIINNANNWLITFPTTYHPILDNYLQQHTEIKRKLLKRVNLKNEWKEDVTEAGWGYIFGHRDGRFPDGYYNNSNCNVILSNLNEIVN